MRAADRRAPRRWRRAAARLAFAFAFAASLVPIAPAAAAEPQAQESPTAQVTNIASTADDAKDVDAADTAGARSDTDTAADDAKDSDSEDKAEAEEEASGKRQVQKSSAKISSDDAFDVGSLDEMKNAFAQINGESAGEYIISLTSDIVLVSQGITPVFKVPVECTVTLLGNGHTITYNSDTQSAQSELTLGTGGGTLNLGAQDGSDTLTITTNNAQNHADPLISVLQNGTVNMYEGVTLTGNTCTSSNAGGVDIQAGMFNMYGGTISSCESLFGYGGAVWVDGSSAFFNMYDGAITENKATGSYNSNKSYGGGVCVSSGASFTMSGGTITRNASNTYGGGVCVYAATANITGGSIVGNACDGGYGGGICNFYGTMAIGKAKVEGNIASNGGGICAYGINYKSYTGRMDVSNCVIKGNKATNAGGMFVVYSSDVKLLSCTITENQADSGGGAYAFNGEIKFTSTEISGNQADVGGGLAVENASDVSAGTTGNIICNNTATQEAADVYIDGENVKVTLPNAMAMNRIFKADGENNMIDGWYQDTEDSRYAPNEQGEAVPVDGELSGSQRLVASYKAPRALTVTFDLQDGTWTDANDIYAEKDGNYEESVYEGQKAHQPNDPEKEGHVFGGWYTDKDYSDENKYDFDSSVVTENITLYAKWLKKPELLNEAPVINAEDKTLTVGDKFDAKDGVTATDAEDGDITDKVEVISNNVDTSKAGIYEVTYQVTDSQGASVTKTITVTVRETDPQNPTTDDNEKPGATEGVDSEEAAVTTVLAKTGDAVALAVPALAALAAAMASVAFLARSSARKDAARVRGRRVR